MLIDIEFTAEMAELAEAAYADFDSGLGTQRSLKNSGFSDTQATEFLADWTLVPGTHQPDTTTGFSATVFQSKGNGEYTLAIRGTVPNLDDLGTDLGDIVLDGLAVDQIIDMYNYYQKLTHAGGYQGVTLQKIEPVAELGTSSAEYAKEHGLLYLKSLPGLDFEVGGIYKVVAKSFTDGIGVISAETPLHVTGHSLGGHLAAAFSRLFSGVTADVTMVNGAGFSTGSPAIANNFNVTNLFSMMGGASDFPSDKITNYIGSGLTVVAQNESIGLKQPGGMTTVEIEDHLRGTLGHGAVQMTDSLAVMSILWQLDNRLSVAQLNQVLLEASSSASRTLETVINTVAKVFGYSTIPDGADNLGPGREAFYATLEQIQARLDLIGVTSPFSVTLLGGRTGSDIAALAGNADAATTPENLAVRFALSELSTFAIVGYNYDSSALSIYNPETGQGSLTQEWITDRADFLKSLIDGGIYDSTSKTAFAFDDLETRKHTITDPAFYSTTNGAVIFGKRNEADPELVGSVKNDRLYGGQLADVIYGLAGNDYLEGGIGSDKLDGGADSDTLIGMSGNDTLIGGQGNDTLNGGIDNDRYEFKDGDGFDRIIDSDGQGSLLLNCQPLPVGKQVALNSNVWVSADGKVKFSLSDQGLLISYGVNDQILIEGYTQGSFGLTLSDYQAVTAPLPVLGSGPFTVGNGVLKKAYYIDQSDGSIDAVDYYVIGSFQGRIDSQGKKDDLGNSLDQSYLNDQAIVFDAATFPLRDFEGGNKNDSIIGSDNLYGDSLKGGGGDDFIDGKSGHDVLHGDEGNDYILGGAGSDDLFGEKRHSNDSGGSGDDYLEAGSGVDRVSGGGGNDEIHGGLDEDGLTGGVGQDRIFGDEGNDLILGDGYFKADDDSSTWLDISIRLQADFSANKSEYNDYLDGGEGDDWINGEAGSDTIIGGDGDDRLMGDRETKENYAIKNTYYVTDYVDMPVEMNGDDLIIAGRGSDYVIGGGGNDALYGGEDRDFLFGDLEDGEDTVYAGNDLMFGDGGDDQLVAGGGDDYLNGGSGNDLMIAGKGNDTLEGGTGEDELQGGEGNDYLFGGDGVDKLFGQEGNDVIDAGAGGDRVWAAEGDDFIRGGEGDDSLVGVLGNDTIYGDAGNDTLFGEAGSDMLYGGEGDDWVQDWFDAQSADVNVLHGDGGNDTVLSTIGKDTLFGGSGNDHVQSGSNDDALFGDAGDDGLLAQEGDDRLTGGKGDDYLFGSSGDDTYLFDSGDGFDYIKDNSGSLSLVFGAGVSSTDLIIQQSPNTTYINYGADKISITNSSFLRLCLR